MTSTTTILQGLDICKRFGSNEVLKGVSVTAQKGDVISMIGFSGSGMRNTSTVVLRRWVLSSFAISPDATYLKSWPRIAQ